MLDACSLVSPSNVTWSGPTCHGHFLLMQQSSSTAASESLRHWHGCVVAGIVLVSKRIRLNCEIWDEFRRLQTSGCKTRVTLRDIASTGTWTSKPSTSDDPDLPSRYHICWLVPALSNHSDIAHASLCNDHSPLSFWMFMLCRCLSAELLMALPPWLHAAVSVSADEKSSRQALPHFLQGRPASISLQEYWNRTNIFTSFGEVYDESRRRWSPPETSHGLHYTDFRLPMFWHSATAWSEVGDTEQSTCVWVVNVTSFERFLWCLSKIDQKTHTLLGQSFRRSFEWFGLNCVLLFSVDYTLRLLSSVFESLISYINHV